MEIPVDFLPWIIPLVPASNTHHLLLSSNREGKKVQKQADNLYYSDVLISHRCIAVEKVWIVHGSRALHLSQFSHRISQTVCLDFILLTSGFNYVEFLSYSIRETYAKILKYFISLFCFHLCTLLVYFDSFRL